MSTKKTLLSDKKLTIDSRGRLRIGGRFTSAQQAGRWRGARRRRGLSIRPVQSVPDTKRAARRQRARGRARAAPGATFLFSKYFKAVNATAEFWRLEPYNSSTIQAVINDVKRRGKTGITYNSILSIETPDQQDVVSAKSRIDNEDTVDDLLDDISRLYGRYFFGEFTSQEQVELTGVLRVAYIGK